MFAKRIPLFKLLGFQVWLDWTWFILALLITWSLATVLFPKLYEEAGLTPTVQWSMGVAGAAGLFVSIVLHELGHSVVARRFGMQMRGITLFIFGGVAEMTDEPPSAIAEFFVAIAGPVVSFLIGVGMLGMTTLGATLDWPTAIVGVTRWLGWINLVLVGFNLVPAFPLDGGRVFRAGLWYWKGDLRWATRVASSVGGMFGIVLIAIGLLSLFAGNFIGGVWWVVIGLFLRGASSASYQQVLLRRALEGEPVARFMSASPIVVPPDIPISTLIDEYFYRYYHRMYPVASNGHLVGCVSIADVKALPQHDWPVRTVTEIMSECGDANTVRADDDAMRALAKLNASGESRLMVVDDGQLVGILSLKDLLRFLSLRGRKTRAVLVQRKDTRDDGRETDLLRYRRP
jgi:Zn-dependent protease/predicted transcriptional regulator